MISPAKLSAAVPEINRELFARLGVSFASREELAASLPFSLHDVTAGSESELQAVVCGAKDDVDLPLIIEQSNYFANIVKRAAAGETPQRVVADLERFLADNPSRVWENSWVRFPARNLSRYAQEVLETDLLADKKNPAAGKRVDVTRFTFRDEAGEEMLRLPISYLIKLALADLIGSQQILPDIIRQAGIRLLEHFLNDNTSPETFSFNVVALTPGGGMGRAIAKETAIRFLMTQLLVMYANQAFGISDRGQQAMVYFAPHPPIRQKELNDHVPDSFYRELFMSPCLSGWDKGEDKFRYMQLCHQVLSRSQLNAVAKLRDAGIIQTNLVVLPNLSNISLANNGTHISIGSRCLTQALASGGPGFTAGHEKHLGDLAIKITEHFLPLFVGTYTAAPYRQAFTDFHPEKALGFLPHELDYTHLRMIWRRWKKKADLSIFGQPITPFGPQALDRLVSSVFRLKGDFVPDYRLIDYLVCLLSTERSPGLNGQPGNSDRLRRDLADMGVFDEQMSVYLLYKQREFAKMGFSGFEGRYYSLFGTFGEDMARAADLQTLITALAYQYMALGMTHANIPDIPSVESERRQIFFGAAIGIPTFYVHRHSSNSFLDYILKKTDGIRSSRRYPGYLRVQIHEYRRALLQVIREDAGILIDLMGLHDTLDDLERRLNEPDCYSAAGRLTAGILGEVNASSPMRVNAREFNTGAERFYRTTLRNQHLAEAFTFLLQDCRLLDREQSSLDESQRNALRAILHGHDAGSFVESATEDVMHERADIATLQRLMNLVLFKVCHDEAATREETGKQRRYADDAAPVYRAG
ncbi:hypothetical protein KI809_17705 [Geobacter pelophilus]|uniref:Uncharacterized protein n=1 Tax=Geoanaerobacter pelophilus TaxID=60036 RepID=A0AAW4L8H1_9BACT|nr:hypothetical protein [Geoanaerobacter pelophilus]MBT0666150.1 hypothetical protein [Geoanaerobacter pelophilus]